MTLDLLIQNLTSQVEMHQALLDILNREKQIPASCSLTELREIYADRDFATQRIFDLESARIGIMKDYREKNGIETDVSLKELIGNISARDGKKLTDLRYQLNRLILKIQSVGKQNAEKAVARISCFREIQNSVHKSFNRHSVYSVNGKMTQPSGACMLRKSI
jgi:flagellar biosynthesis/type III secretory pathway chaperone